MLNLKDQVFGDKGYTADLKLGVDELNTFRSLVNEHWLKTITQIHPELTRDAQKLGIENYHLIEHRLNHQTLWPKANRVLPQAFVQQVKKLPFFTILHKEFGQFSISDIYDTKQHYGEEEIYWRLVRPHIESDVGPLHKDKWFHGAFNMGYGMFPEGTTTVKVWIPLYCENGKSGLALLAGSHHHEWEYHIEMVNGIPYPKPKDDLSNIGAKLIPTDPGNLIIFNENILHGGVLNVGEKTRISAEITMVLSQKN